MREITIIYDGRSFTYSWLKPMFWAREEFRRQGYHIKCYSLTDYFPFIHISRTGTSRDILWLEKLLGNTFDIVFLAFHHAKSWLGQCSSEDRCRFLCQLKNNANLVCWLDIADSTGTCLFDVLPYVDKYMKKQVIKDKSLYAEKMYGGRCFTDYYHKKLKLVDESIESNNYPTLDRQYEDKICLSWNIGLSDMFANRWERYLLINHITIPNWSDWTKGRDIDIHYRGTGKGSLIGYQRRCCGDFLVKQEKWAHPDIKTRVSKPAFLRELNRSKAVLSPFGWGEVCFRDFESYAAGATLLKPSMEHCETWPDVYKANETYVPIKWDLSDLSQVLEEVGSARYQQIARNGQALYKDTICSEQSKYDFVEHIIKSIEG